MKPTNPTKTINTKVPGKLRMIQTGDIHFCHKRTPTANLIKTMNYLFYENESLKDVDLVVLNGDVWDSLVEQPNVDALCARQWIRKFVNDCGLNDVELYVLEGTPDHDWKQSKEFVAYDTPCSVHYIDQLSITHLERFNLDVLWVPDECRPTTEGVWQDACSLLAKSGLDQVDLAFVHGGFDFQYPGTFEVKVHSSERYSSITRYGVFANHVHKAGQCLKVFGPGSPDRLRQGEDEDKGYHRVVLDLNTQKCYVDWLPNPYAWEHVSLNVDGLSHEEVVHEARTRAKTLRGGSFICLKNGDPDVVKAALTPLRLEFPALQWELKNKKKKEGLEATEELYTYEQYKGTSASKDNANELTVGWLLDRKLITQDDVAFVQSVLAEVLSEL